MYRGHDLPTLRLFAALREAAGVAEVKIQARTTEELIEKAAGMFGPNFSAQVERAAAAVNGREIPREQWSEAFIGPDDEVALLPPVSGG